MLLKFCTDCNQGRGRLLPTSFFHMNAAQPDGLCSQCMHCTRKRRQDRPYRRPGIDPDRIYQECRVCGDLLPLSDFDRHAGRALGYVDRCRNCRRLAWIEMSMIAPMLDRDIDPDFYPLADEIPTTEEDDQC